MTTPTKQIHFNESILVGGVIFTNCRSLLVMIPHTTQLATKLRHL